MTCSMHYIIHHKVTFSQWIAQHYTNKHATIQPHALNTSFVLYLTKCYTTTQLMLTPYRCIPSQVANNPHSWESGHFPVKQFVTQGKLPFTQVYQMSFIISKHFCMDILKNIISHYSDWTENRQHSTHQSICATRRFNMSRSVHYIKLLTSCTPFAMFTSPKMGLHLLRAPQLQ